MGQLSEAATEQNAIALNDNETVTAAAATMQKPLLANEAERLLSVAPTANKSLWRAYLCWLFGGVFGLHHFYLGRDRQAFICWSTFGGYLFGCLGDLVLMPEMVRDANNDPRFVDAFKERLRKKTRPPFTLSQFSNTLMVAFLWAQVSMIAIPDADYGNFAVLHIAVPAVVAVAVWTVGNCGRQRGAIGPCLLAAYAAYPLRLFVGTEKYWLYAVIVASSMAFEYWSKQWLLTTPRRRSVKRRVATLYVCGAVYLSLFGSYVYFNAKITTGEGDVVPVHQWLGDVAQSPWWAELKQQVGEFWGQMQHRGYYETWRMLVDSIDTEGESKAYKTLGLTQTATQTEITSAFRRLSKENHPDKIKGTPAMQRAAQERFMAISQAYEKLSQLKSKRRQRNRKSTDPNSGASINL